MERLRDPKNPTIDLKAIEEVGKFLDDPFSKPVDITRICPQRTITKRQKGDVPPEYCGGVICAECQDNNDTFKYLDVLSKRWVGMKRLVLNSLRNISEAVKPHLGVRRVYFYSGIKDGTPFDAKVSFEQKENPKGEGNIEAKRVEKRKQ